MLHYNTIIEFAMPTFTIYEIKSTISGTLTSVWHSSPYRDVYLSTRRMLNPARAAYPLSCVRKRSQRIFKRSTPNWKRTPTHSVSANSKLWLVRTTWLTKKSWGWNQKLQKKMKFKKISQNKLLAETQLKSQSFVKKILHKNTYIKKKIQNQLRAE